MLGGSSGTVEPGSAKDEWPKLEQAVPKLHLNHVFSANEEFARALAAEVHNGTACIPTYSTTVRAS